MRSAGAEVILPANARLLGTNASDRRTQRATAAKNSGGPQLFMIFLLSG